MKSIDPFIYDQTGTGQRYLDILQSELLATITEVVGIMISIIYGFNKAAATPTISGDVNLLDLRTYKK